MHTLRGELRLLHKELQYWHGGELMLKYTIFGATLGVVVLASLVWIPVQGVVVPARAVSRVAQNGYEFVRNYRLPRNASTLFHFSSRVE